MSYPASCASVGLEKTSGLKGALQSGETTSAILHPLPSSSALKSGLPWNRS
jgi:hypothetical protein